MMQGHLQQVESAVACAVASIEEPVVNRQFARYYQWWFIQRFNQRLTEADLPVFKEAMLQWFFKISPHIAYTTEITKDHFGAAYSKRYGITPLLEDIGIQEALDAIIEVLIEQVLARDEYPRHLYTLKKVPIRFQISLLHKALFLGLLRGLQHRGYFLKEIAVMMGMDQRTVSKAAKETIHV